MLPSSARLRSSDALRQTVRGGVRAARPTLVVHARYEPELPTRVGFVVSKAVGGAVVRNRVKRRLRHLVRPFIEGCPTGVHIVVRALPAAASQPTRLADDVTEGWRAAIRKLERGRR